MQKHDHTRLQKRDKARTGGASSEAPRRRHSSAAKMSVARPRGVCRVVGASVHGYMRSSRQEALRTTSATDTACAAAAVVDARAEAVGALRGDAAAPADAADAPSAASGSVGRTNMALPRGGRARRRPAGAGARRSTRAQAGGARRVLLERAAAAQRTRHAAKQEQERAGEYGPSADVSSSIFCV